MIHIRVLEILQEKKLTKYWLYKRMGMSYQNLNRLLNNQTCSIHYDNIEKLCRALNCTPSDLFVISPGDGQEENADRQDSG